MSRESRLGYDAEHEVERVLVDAGHRVFRPRAGSRRDRGDFLGLAVTVSVKNRAVMALSEWLAEVARYKATNGHAVGVVWHKRRGRGCAHDWYVTMTGSDFLELIKDYHR